jgi:hypothetical protein
MLMKARAHITLAFRYIWGSIFNWKLSCRMQLRSKERLCNLAIGV